MKTRLLVFSGILIGFSTLPAFADIYVWTDGDGVKHFTNFAPPDKASIFIIEPTLASISAPVEQQNDSERLREAEKKIDDLNAEVTELKQQLEKQQTSKDTYDAQDGSDPPDDAGVTEHEPYNTSDRYDRSRYEGYSYVRTYIRSGTSGSRYRRHFTRHHYGYYYPRKDKYRYYKKLHRHYKSHRFPKHHRHYKHRIVFRRHGHPIKHHRSGRHTGFRMGYRHRR